MKILSCGLTIIFAVIIGCRHTDSKVFGDKALIDQSSVTSVAITKIIRMPDTSKSIQKYLTKEQIISFTDKWNNATDEELIKYMPTFLIEIHFKNNSTRMFRVNGWHIKEKNDWSYDVKDKGFFENLFSEASLQEIL